MHATLSATLFVGRSVGPSVGHKDYKDYKELATYGDRPCFYKHTFYKFTQAQIAKNKAHR